MKKVTRIFLIIFAVIVILAGIIALIWGGEISTVKSVREVNSNEMLYEMEYKAGYDLDEIINADIDSNTKLLEFVIAHLSRGLYKPHVEKAGNGYSCTSFQVRNADGEGYLFGRNYDFFKNPIMVVHAHPKNGYASLSTCDMSHFGYSTEKLPDSFTAKALCLASVYAPMDGINEKGLCTSILALPAQAAFQNTGKHCVGTSILMRLWLDRCATVDEALALLETVDVRHDQKAGSGYHYMVADASGDCAVVEFDKEDGWKTMIVRKSGDYMHVTNHLLSPKYYTEEPDETVGNPRSRSWMRYATVRAYLEDHDGALTIPEAQACLASVHWDDFVWENGLVESTQYSNVYDQSALTLSMRPWNDYGTTYLFGINN